MEKCKMPYQFMLDDDLRQRIEEHMKKTGKATMSSVVIAALNEYLRISNHER